MYVQGDRVIYGTIGVVEIVDIVEQTVGDVTRKYYVMKEYSSPSSSLTYVPLDNDALLAQIKPLLAKDEIVATVKEAKSADLIEWIDDNRARAESYKRILASGDRVRMLAMIDYIYKTGLRREAEGKRNFIADETSMRRAQKMIASEFSLVLGIPEDEVGEFIKNI